MLPIKQWEETTYSARLVGAVLLSQLRGGYEEELAEDVAHGVCVCEELVIDYRVYTVYQARYVRK